MYGLTGMGLGSAADWATEQFGVENKNSYIAMKYGLIDWLIAEYSPVETAVATRLAPITAFADLYRDIIGGEASLIETLSGPSGQITSGIVGQFWETTSELINGHTVSLTQDALNILRQPSGLDNLAKGWGILNNGVYRSKTGATLPTELKPSDAIAQFFGFSALEVSEFYSRKRSSFMSSKQRRTFQKEMERDYSRALSLYATDPQTASALVGEVMTKIALTDLSEFEKGGIRSRLLQGRGDEIYKIQLDLYRRDKNFVGGMVDQILGDNN